MSNSFANLPARQVLDTCASWLEQRKNFIRSERELLVDAAMTQRNWLGRPKFSSREAAQAYLSFPDLWTNWHFISWAASEERVWVTALHRLAALALEYMGDHALVCVTSRDARALSFKFVPGGR